MFVYMLPFKSIAYITIPQNNMFNFVSWSFNIPDDAETIVCLITNNTDDENQIFYVDDLKLTIQ